MLNEHRCTLYRTLNVSQFKSSGHSMLPNRANYPLILLHMREADLPYLHQGGYVFADVYLLAKYFKFVNRFQ